MHNSMLSVRVILQKIRYTAKTVLLTVVLLIVSFFFPIAGQVILISLISYCLGVSYLTTTGYLHGLRLKQQQQMLHDHQFVVWGYGLASYTILLIPCAILVVLPGIITGGTLLFNQELKEL